MVPGGLTGLVVDTNIVFSTLQKEGMTRKLFFLNRKKAYEMCKDIDEADTPFVALALELDIPLWSGDKKLAKGLKDKKFDKILTNHDLLQERFI